MINLKKLLTALKITDPDNTISLTSIGVMIILAKIAWAPALDWATAATLLLALLSYNAKKVIRSKEKVRAADDDNKLKQVEDKIAELNKAFAVSTMFKK